MIHTCTTEHSLQGPTCRCTVEGKSNSAGQVSVMWKQVYWGIRTYPQGSWRQYNQGKQFNRGALTCTTEHAIGCSSGIFYIEGKSKPGHVSCMWVEVTKRPLDLLHQDPFGKLWYRGIPIIIKDSLK